MSPTRRQELLAELLKRGFTSRETVIASPNDSMVFGHEFLSQSSLAELLEQMVARREKIFRSVPVVGPDLAKQNYADVIAAIDSVKSVIDRLERSAIDP